jgi:ABC-2 type transport system permease protein
MTQLAFFGFALGALALALAAIIGRKAVAAAGAGAFAVIGFLINGFAPLVTGLDWLKYLSPFYYYAYHDPLTNGIDWAGLIVLALAAISFTAVAVSTQARSRTSRATATVRHSSQTPLPDTDPSLGT